MTPEKPEADDTWHFAIHDESGKLLAEGRRSEFVAKWLSLSPPQLTLGQTAVFRVTWTRIP